MKEFNFLPENFQCSPDGKHNCKLTPNREFIPLDIGLSDFMLFFTLLRMQIALEEMKRALTTFSRPAQKAQIQNELDTCGKFYEQYLSTFN